MTQLYSWGRCWHWGNEGVAMREGMGLRQSNPASIGQPTPWKLLPKTPCMRILFPCLCGLGRLRSLPSMDLISKQCFWVHEIKKCKLANKPNGYLNIFKLSHSSVYSTLATQGWSDITYKEPNNILCVVGQKVSGQRDTQMKGDTRNLNMQKQITACICFIGFSYWPLNPRVFFKKKEVWELIKYNEF